VDFWHPCWRLVDCVSVALYSVALIFRSAFRPVPYCFGYCYSVMSFEIKKYMSSLVSFSRLISQDGWQNLAIMFFCGFVELVEFFLFLLKNIIEILIQIALNL
jgi:hypothetical protein